MKSSASAPSLTWWTLLAKLAFLRARSARSASCRLSSTSRISTSSNPTMPFSFRERKGEHSAPTHRSLRPDSASVSMDDSLDERQSQPRALKLLGGVEALEDPKQLVDVLLREAHAVIPVPIGILPFP